MHARRSWTYPCGRRSAHVTFGTPSGCSRCCRRRLCVVWGASSLPGRVVKSAPFVLKSAELGPSLFVFVAYGPRLAKPGSSLVELNQNRAELSVQIMSSSSPVWTDSTELESKSTQFWPNCVQIWSSSSQFWSTAVQLRPNQVQVWSSSTEIEVN